MAAVVVMAMAEDKEADENEDGENPNTAEEDLAY